MVFRKIESSLSRSLLAVQVGDLLLQFRNALAGLDGTGMTGPGKRGQDDGDHQQQAQRRTPARIERASIFIFLRSQVDVKAHYPSRAPATPAIKDGGNCSPLRFWSDDVSGASSCTCAPVCWCSIGAIVARSTAPQTRISAIFSPNVSSKNTMDGNTASASSSAVTA